MQIMHDIKYILFKIVQYHLFHKLFKTKIQEPLYLKHLTNVMSNLVRSNIQISGII